MPEKILYHFASSDRDPAFNPNNAKALEAWIASFDGQECGHCKRFFADHYFEVRSTYHDLIEITFFPPKPGGVGTAYDKKNYRCRIRETINRYGRSYRVSISAGGKRNWAEFFAQLDNALLVHKLATV